MPTSCPASSSRHLRLLPLLLCLVVLGTVSCSKQARKERAAQRADRYFNAGDFDKARIEYFNVLRMDGSNTNAIKQLGLIYMEQGSPLQAAPFLARALAGNSNDMKVRLKLGAVQVFARKFADARDSALAVLQHSPTNDEAVLLLADASVTPEHVQGAQQRLQALRQSTGDRASFHLAQAQFLLRQRNAVAAEQSVEQALALDPRSSGAHLVMVAVHLSRTNLAEAERELKQAAELAPMRSPTRLRYAEFKARAGKVDEAKALLEEVTKSAPDYVPAWSMLAQFVFAEKKYDDTLALLDKVLSRDPTSYDARMLGARVQLARGRPARAIEDLEKIRAIYATVPEIHYQLALAYRQNTNAARALASVNEALRLNTNYVEAILVRADIGLAQGRPAEVVSSMSQLLRQHPEVVQAHLLLADAYRNLGKLDEAVAVCQRMVQIFPKAPRTRVVLGTTLRLQGKNKEARAALEEALRMSPNDNVALFHLVEVEILEKNFAPALARVQELAVKNPQSHVYPFLEAKVYVAQANWDRAEAALLKTLELNPAYGDAYGLLVSTYMASKKIPKAIERVEAWLVRYPKDTRSLMLAGMLYNAVGDYPKSRAAYEMVLAASPPLAPAMAAPAMNDLAYLYAEHFGLMDKAYELANQARQAVPADPAVADTLGWIQYKRGEYEAALRLIQESAAKLSASPEVQFHLGMAAYALGQTESARAALEKALQTGGDFRGKAEAQQRLAVLGTDLTKPPQELIADFEKLLQANPGDLLVLTRLAQLYDGQGMADKAAAAYGQILKANPRSATANLKLAQFHAGPKRNPELAMTYARKARELAPDDSQVAAVLGHLALGLGDHAWAFNLLQESAPKLTNQPGVHYDLAWAAYSLGRVPEAEQSMKQALRANAAFTQTNAAQWFLLMISLYTSGGANDPAAEAQASKLLTSDPNNVPALMVLAGVKARRGDARAAADTYEAILGRFPKFALAQKHLAGLLADAQGDDKKAYDLAVKAWETLPSDPDLAKTLGKLAYRRKDYPYAIRVLSESAQARPNDGETQFYLGMSHYQRKEKDQSRQSLQKAVALSPNAAFAAEAARTLKEL